MRITLGAPLTHVPVCAVGISVAYCSVLGVRFENCIDFSITGFIDKLVSVVGKRLA